MEQDLGKKLFTGTLWLVSTRLALRGLSIISTIALAWLLTTADFGIVAMASIVTELMVACTEIGMKDVIIYHRDTDRKFYDTAWTIQLIRGVVLGIILFLFSNPIASIFNEQQLIPVFRVLSIVFILNGMISTNIAIFQKEMRFNVEFYYRISTQIVNLVGTIALALWLRNYWAMVFGNIIFAISCVVISFWFAPIIPKPTLLYWRKILSFSQWIAFRQLVAVISQKIDQIMIGRWFGKEFLGQYNMATQISTIPSTEISRPLSFSLLPALAKLQDQQNQFRFTLSMSLAAVLISALPVSFGLMMIAKPLVSLLLPPQWVLVGTIIQILALFGLASTISSPLLAAMASKGKVREVFFINIIIFILKCGILYLGYILNGYIGVAWGTVISAAVEALVYLWNINRDNYLDVSILLKQLWRPVFATTIMIVSVYGIQRTIIVMKYGAYVEVSTMIVIGMVTYVVALLGTWRIVGKPEGVETSLLNMTSDLVKKIKIRIMDFLHKL